MVERAVADGASWRGRPRRPPARPRRRPRRASRVARGRRARRRRSRRAPTAPPALRTPRAHRRRRRDRRCRGEMDPRRDVAHRVVEAAVRLEDRTEREVRRHRAGLAVARHRDGDRRGFSGPTLAASMPSDAAPRGEKLWSTTSTCPRSRSRTSPPSGQLRLDGQAPLAAVHLVPDAGAVPEALTWIGTREHLGPDLWVHRGAPCPAGCPDQPAPRLGRDASARRVLDLDDVDAEVGEEPAGERARPTRC